MPTRKAPKSPRDQMARTRIYLWRHPEVIGGPEGKFWGQTDVGLTKRGQNQATAMARYMGTKKINAVYSSDLVRTRQPADAIARAAKLRQKAMGLPTLRELDLGQWEGKTYLEIDKQYPGALTQRSEDLAGYVIDGGESLNQMAERVMPAFQEVVARHQGGNICLVCHAGVNRIILTKLMGAPLDRIFRLDQSYACLNLIDVFADGVPLIRSLNMELVALHALMTSQGPQPGVH